jgi:hypothetical protein
MKHTPVITSTLALTMLLVSGTFAAEYPIESRALYSTVHLLSFFNKDHAAACKVSDSQEKDIKSKANEARRQKIWVDYLQESEKVKKSKLPDKEQYPKLRALEVKASDEMFRVYAETLRPDQIKRMKQILAQMHGMDLFEFPAVRNALKIDDKEVKGLRAAWDKWAFQYRMELEADLKANKITREEAARRAGNARNSVPDPILELLNADQRAIIVNLVGEKFTYSK